MPGQPSRYLLFADQLYSFPILQPLSNELQRRGLDVRWLLQGNALASEKSSEGVGDPSLVVESIVDAVRFNPDVVATPNNLVPYFLPGMKVELFHGFNARKRSRGELDSHFAIRGFFDLYCTQGPSTTSVFEVLAERHGTFGVRETGWPKMDNLFPLPAVDQTAGRNKTIMMTSTFSKELSCAPVLFEEVSRLVEERDWHWIFQFHPKMDPSVTALYESLDFPNAEFVRQMNVAPWMQRADIMVSDTSSVLQEFLQLRRPVVTFRNRTPGPWLIDFSESRELERNIELALSYPEELLQEVDAYNGDLHPYDDGCSSARVIDAIAEFYSTEYPTLGPKPLNLVRKLKMRKAFGYWGG